MNGHCNFERTLVAGSCLLAVASFAWFVGGGREGAGAGAAVEFPLTGGAFERSRSADRPTKPARWERPKAQPAGAEWVYELFTPPRIHFDPGTQRFSVVAPLESRAPLVPERVIEAPARAPGTEAEEGELFPLQLVGFVEGEPCLGIFAVPATGETIVARSGTTVKSLGLEIEHVSVVWRRVALPESMAVPRRSARAMVRSFADGRRRELTDLECEPAVRSEPRPGVEEVPALAAGHDGGPARPGPTAGGRSLAVGLERP